MSDESEDLIWQAEARAWDEAKQWQDEQALTYENQEKRIILLENVLKEAYEALAYHGGLSFEPDVPGLSIDQIIRDTGAVR